MWRVCAPHLAAHAGRWPEKQNYRTGDQRASWLTGLAGGATVEEDSGFGSPDPGIEGSHDQVDMRGLGEGIVVAAPAGRERHGGQRLLCGVDRRPPAPGWRYPDAGPAAT